MCHTRLQREGIENVVPFVLTLCKIMASDSQATDYFDADFTESQMPDDDVLDCDVEKVPKKRSADSQPDGMPPPQRARTLKPRASNASSFADDEFIYVPDEDEEDVPLSQTSHPADDDAPPPLAQSIPQQVSAVAPLVNEVGTVGCIFGPDAHEGVAVDGGFEMLVRIALRCLNLSPRHMLERLAFKYASPMHTAERVSTTYSGTDCIVDHKLAVIVATRMMAGLMVTPGNRSFCAFAIHQTIAAESDDWKRKALIENKRHDSHSLQAVAKAP